MQSKFRIKESHLIIISTIILALTGIIMIYSASSYSAEKQFGDAYYYVKKQSIAFAAGIIFMITGGRIRIEFLKKIKWCILAVSVILLSLVFVPKLGVESYGATRWLNLGVITIQPSELAKFGLMIFLAAYMTDYPPTNLKRFIVPALSAGVICALIILEPNMSITMCVGMAFIILVFVAGLQNKWLAVIVGLLAVAVPLLIVLEPYRLKRFFAFLDPWQNPKDEGYQLIQSYYALGNGGLFGVGLFASRQKYLFLPFAESDFIFSVIGEELGLVGCVAVIVVFSTLVICGARAALNAKDRFGCLLATGLTTIIALQTIINLTVVTGMIPPTGVPLPYVSAGGTGLVTFMFVSGILYNVSAGETRESPRVISRKSTHLSRFYRHSMY